MSNEKLLAIIQEARQMAIEDATAPLIDCPICGTRLDENDGVVNCPLGHYRKRGRVRSVDER